MNTGDYTLPQDTNSLMLHCSTINLNKGIWYVESSTIIGSTVVNGSMTAQLSLSTTTTVDPANYILTNIILCNNYKYNNKISGIFKITEDTAINTVINVINGVAYDLENNKTTIVPFTLENTSTIIATRIA